MPFERGTLPHGQVSQNIWCASICLRNWPQSRVISSTDAQRYKNLQSTTKVTNTSDKITGDSPEPAPTPTNIKTHNVFSALVDVWKLHGHLTGKFPVMSSKGHQYILTLYDYDINAISTKPMKKRTDKEIIRAYTALHQQLLNAELILNYKLWTMNAPERSDST
jgi:hypothetical protein